MKRRDALKSMVAMAALPFAIELPVQVDTPIIEKPKGSMDFWFSHNGVKYNTFYMMKLDFNERIRQWESPEYTVDADYKDMFQDNESSHYKWFLEEHSDHIDMGYFNDYKKAGFCYFDRSWFNHSLNNPIQCVLTHNESQQKLIVETIHVGVRTYSHPNQRNLNSTKVISVTDIRFKKVQS